MISDDFEAWLVALLAADDALRAEFARQSCPVLIRRGAARLRQARERSRPRQEGGAPGLFITFDLLASVQERFRCGDDRLIDLTYQVKAVAPGDSTDRTRAVAGRIHALLSGASHQLGGGSVPTADSTTAYTADSTTAFTADATDGTGARWLVRREQVVHYVEAADPHRYVHQGGVYTAQIAL